MNIDWLTREILCPKPKREHDADLRAEYIFTGLWPLLSGPFLGDGFDIVTRGAFRSGDRVTRVVLSKYTEVKTITRERWSWLPLDLDDHYHDRNDADQGLDFDYKVSRRRYVTRELARAWLDDVSELVARAPVVDDMCDGASYMVVIRQGGWVRSGSFYLRYAPDVQALLRNIEWQDVRELDAF
jgi:hypothetical protein